MKPKKRTTRRQAVPHTNNPDYRYSPPRQLKNGWVELDGARIADAWLMAERGGRRG